MSCAVPDLLGSTHCGKSAAKAAMAISTYCGHLFLHLRLGRQRVHGYAAMISPQDYYANEKEMQQSENSHIWQVERLHYSCLSYCSHLVT